MEKKLRHEYVNQPITILIAFNVDRRAYSAILE
jgi:hypothetical protein